VDLPEGPFLGQTPTIEDKTGDSLHFRPMKETEAEYIQDLRDKMSKLSGEIGLCDRILVAKNSPGFTEFIKAVTLKRDITRRDMEGCYGDDSMLRILQGRCQALTSMALILNDTEHLKTNLTRDLDALREQETATVRQDDKRVRTQPLGG
jgi:hypothetical protein